MGSALMVDIRTLLRGLSLRLSTSSTPRLDAELIVQHVLASDRAYLHAHPEYELSFAAIEQVESAVQRREAGEPMAYILGQCEFYGRPFSVSPSVLIPRPETELLVERALRYISEHFLSSARIGDLGTGSGCLAITLDRECAKRQMNARLVAVDRSLPALRVASKNAKQLHAEVTFLQSDWSACLLPESFDLIVSNPPYVEEGFVAPIGNLSYEPSEALFSGPDGMSDIRRLLRDVPSILAREGLLLIECGKGQREAIEAAARELQSLDILWSYDLAGIPRVAEIRKKHPW